MAQSTCPNPECKGHKFELAANTPKGANIPIYFVQCERCGTVVGTQETDHIGYLIRELAKRLGHEFR